MRLCTRLAGSGPRSIHPCFLAALLAAAAWLASARPAGACSYALGFAALHDLIPAVVGACRVDEHHNPLNGDGLQETTGTDGRGGLLVWRKSDNWTAYTDGYRTWINGPRGLEWRYNADRFDWEGPAPAHPPAPAVALARDREAGTAVLTVDVPPGDRCTLTHVAPPAGPLDLGTVDADPVVGGVRWAWSTAGRPLGGALRIECAQAGVLLPIDFK